MHFTDQIFALDSAVIKTQYDLTRLKAIHHHRETKYSN